MKKEEIRREIAPITREIEVLNAEINKDSLTLEDVMLALAYVRQDIAALRSDLAVTFSLDEFDAKRKQMNDELVDKVMKRIAAEQYVKQMMGMADD